MSGLLASASNGGFQWHVTWHSLAHVLALFVRTIPYTQNLDLGVARAQYPVPGQTPKYNGSTGWSNRGIDGPLENFNDYRNAMAMRNIFFYFILPPQKIFRVTRDLICCHSEIHLLKASK